MQCWMGEAPREASRIWSLVCGMNEDQIETEKT